MTGAKRLFSSLERFNVHSMYKKYTSFDLRLSALKLNISTQSLNKGIFMKTISNRHGFTLAEMLVGMMIGGLVLMGASQILYQVLLAKKDFDSSINTMSEVNLVSNYLSHQLYMAGGNGITAWQSLKVENNCAARMNFPDCNGTDRLTVAINTTEPVAGVKTYKASFSPYSYDSTSGTVTLLAPLAPPASCPLTAVLPPGHILVVDRDTNQVDSRWVTATDVPNCKVDTAADNQGTLLNKSNGVNNIYFSSTMYFVDLHTYYLDTAARNLYDVSMVSNNLVFDLATEAKLIAPEVFDFQLGLGYDTGVKDGVVLDDGSDTDEILYNNSLDTFAKLGNMGAFEADMRELFVVFTKGLPKKGWIDNSQNFDGPALVAISDYKLSTFKRAFAFRNTMTYK